jgi:hypothetical protein
MEKLSRIPVSRAAMNKLVMNYLVTEGFKVRIFPKKFLIVRKASFSAGKSAG